MMLDVRRLKAPRGSWLRHTGVPYFLLQIPVLEDLRWITASRLDLQCWVNMISKAALAGFRRPCCHIAEYLDNPLDHLYHFVAHVVDVVVIAVVAAVADVAVIFHVHVAVVVVVAVAVAAAAVAAAVAFVVFAVFEGESSLFPPVIMET